MAEIIGETVRQEPAKEAAPGPSDPRGVRAQPPETIAALDRRPPPSVAGGIPAIVASARHVFREAGLLRGTRLLRALNQFDGYDCPGCASWVRSSSRATAWPSWASAATTGWASRAD